MALFQKDDDATHPVSSGSPVETIIGPSVKLEGDFKSDGDIVVEGVMSGTLITKNNLRVGDQAKITANIEAGNAIIAGTVVGNLTIKNKLELGPQAKITGDIEAGTLITADGAQLNGHVKMGVIEGTSSAVKNHSVK